MNDSIDQLLTRGVDTIYPSREALEKVLRGGKKLRLYQGFDPSGTQLHIGHAVGFRKLRQWQDLGHEVIFLIGDGTGQAGDPSGKKKSREKYFTTAELRENGKNYVMQASKIVRFDGQNPVKIMYNGDWLNKLTLIDMLTIAGHFTFQQMLERDLYQERLKSGNDISWREAMYPLLQAYDSVAMKVDLELGGTDQMFNMLCGRKLVKAYLNKEKFVMTVPLLTDSKGIKIGKTEGNVIGITDKPNDFYGKIMQLGDDSIIPCLTLLTDIPLDEIAQIKEQMQTNANPMLFKKRLAFTLTEQFNSREEAEKAQKHFETTFQEKKVSQDIQTFSLNHLSSQSLTLVEILTETHLSKSKTDARRLIEQKAVEIDNHIVTTNEMINLKNGMILKVGKKRFLKLV